MIITINHFETLLQKRSELAYFIYNDTKAYDLLISPYQRNDPYKTVSQNFFNLLNDRFIISVY